MKNIAQITIPQPCHQQWGNMLIAPDGRFCTSCNKTVIDFTTMSNEQIIGILSQNNNTCGRLEEWQIRSVNLKLNQQPAPLINWKSIGLAVSLFFALPVAYAQHKIAKIKPAHYQQQLLKKKIAYKTINGLVTDSADNLPLPGVIVAVKGTVIHTITGQDGKYVINIPDYVDTLAVSFTGYKAQCVSIPYNSLCVDVALTDADRVKIIGYGIRTVTTLTGGVSISVTKKTPFYKRWYYKIIKQPVKKIFG